MMLGQFHMYLENTLQTDIYLTNFFHMSGDNNKETMRKSNHNVPISIPKIYDFNKLHTTISRPIIKYIQVTH